MKKSSQCSKCFLRIYAVYQILPNATIGTVTILASRKLQLSGREN